MTEEADNQSEPIAEIDFHYEKSNFFRVIHADGAHGGIAPQGNKLHIAIYSERKPIPKMEHVLIKLDGSHAPDKDKSIGKSGVIREIEASLLMDWSVARSLHQWLGDRIEEYEKVIVPKLGEIKKAKENDVG